MIRNRWFSVCLPAVLGLALGACRPSRAADAPRQPFSYRQGFEEQAPPLELWAKNGDAEVHFNGPTAEQASEGKRSLKLDVTLKGGSYHYWGIPLKVPCLGKLTISASVRVGDETTARVGFGENFLFPPTPHSGCAPFITFDKPTGGWKRVEEDLVERGRQTADSVLSSYTATARGEDAVPMLDRWSLFILGQPGQRAVVYVDDVRIEGEVPGDAAVQAALSDRKAAAQERLRPRLEAWRASLASAEASLSGAGASSASLRAAVDAYRASLAQAKKALDSVTQQGLASKEEVAVLDGMVANARYARETLAGIAAGEAAGSPYLLYAPRAISNERLLPSSFPIPAPPARELACAGCRGEYEPLSVALYPLLDVKGLQVTATELKGPAGSIPASAVDLSIVKSWYQAGREIYDLRHKTLVPELLLKDDRLVRVDTEKQEISLRSTAPDGAQTYLLCSGPTSEDLANVRPMDAATLQPVDLPARALRQFWITIHIPKDARPGAYQGALRFRTAAGSRELPLRVSVHPFALAPSRLIYSIYYRGVPSQDGKPTISSEGKSEEQYRAEIADMKAHGVLYPTNYLAMDEKRLRRVLEIRREVGLPTGPLFTLGQGTGSGKDATELENVQQGVRKWIALGKEYGYAPVYFYGADEATGEQLLAQRAAWKAVQDAGGRTFVACYKKTFEAMGGLLNCAVLAGRPDPEEARKWHSVGSQAFCYAYPQVGNEEPETYRRNFGLVLWKAGFDGCMDYAYQHSFGHAWNDFDDKTYRDHVFAYPTANGVVDTVQWEGFREAVDDVRYVTTLERAIESAPPARKETARQAREWLDRLDVGAADLDAARTEMAAWIVKLSF